MLGSVRGCRNITVQQSECHQDSVKKEDGGPADYITFDVAALSSWRCAILAPRACMLVGN